ncbi:MAG: hypothetical protein CSA44_00700 [Gammaproteobacteria bacterium]|nr:MAG: hypothetical protein CSA44_00700 [Gammaproteobacteria bacterium]
MKWSNYRHYFIAFVQFIYRHPLVSGIILSFFSGLYLINDFAIVNRSALIPLWQLAQGDSATALGITGSLIASFSQLFDLSMIDAGHLLMLLLHMGITGVMVAIATVLRFSLLSRWALLLLLLAHPNYNDYRTYIITAPLFWLLWLTALLILLLWYRRHSIAVISLWLVLFLVATRLELVAWFWLLLFPFGALVWKPWRRKSVAYALIGYALVVGILLFLPLYQGESPMLWFIEMIKNNPNQLSKLINISDSNWVKEENRLMAAIFIFSGASSLMIIRTLIAFGVVCSGLSIYAIMRKQYHIIAQDQRRIIQYAIAFDILISVMLFIADTEKQSLLGFSTSFLLLFFAALGLSYICKKIQNGGYSKVSVLVIVWCVVAYLATGFIIFGPRKAHIKQAAEIFISEHPKTPVYSNNQFFLFYGDKDPASILAPEIAKYLRQQQAFFYAYEKNRNQALPDFLAQETPRYSYQNRHGDTILVYYLAPLNNGKLKK